MLNQTVIFLLAAVLLVPLCSRFGLGAVLGYLVAGLAIGPAGFSLAKYVEGIAHVSELGIALLLFLIGLELQPSRLWVLRRLVFGLGGAQVLVTGTAFALIGYAMGLALPAAIVTGLGLAMSSTALVMQTLAEKSQLTSRHGRDAFAVLLFQDLAVIPLLALMPLLSSERIDHTHSGLSTALKAVAIIGGAVIASRTIIRPLFRAVISFGGREIFTAAALLLVLGMSLLMDEAGLSMSLGAFLAGVLLADSEYRHELEAAIGPFKSLLLGLFFMSVGMSLNVGLVIEQPLTIAALAFALIGLKAALLFGIRLLGRSPPIPARKLAIALAQGGEFAFVLFGQAAAYRIFDQHQADLLLVVVGVSMLLSPLFMLFDDKYLTALFDREEKPPFDDYEVESTPVIIVGYGRVGQVVSRILNMRGITFTAIDSSPQQVDFVRKFGNKIYYGDPSQLSLLHAAKVDQAKLFVLAMDDVEASLKTAALVRKHFPHVPIYARARNRFHSYKLMDLGVKMLVRETLQSSIDLGAGVLRELGLDDGEVERTVIAFRDSDNKLLLQQHAIYQDEKQLIATSKQATDDLKTLFESTPIGQQSS